MVPSMRGYRGGESNAGRPEPITVEEVSEVLTSNILPHSALACVTNKAYSKRHNLNPTPPHPNPRREIASVPVPGHHLAQCVPVVANTSLVNPIFSV